MDNKKLISKIGFIPKDNTVGVFLKKYTRCDGYSIEVDFENEIINYGDKIESNNKSTQNFKQPENWVVLECVDRLLEKGYKPQNIILEKTWNAGHGTSGRLDVCVTHDDGSEYLLIECKTYGKEFDKALNRMCKDGGQLFTYFKFSNKADIIMLYSSELKQNKVVYKNEIVKIEDDYRSGDVKDFYEKWNKLTKDNGVFDNWVQPYSFESKALTINELEEIKPEDSSFIFNRFLEILRHNVVSDKPNAFNKIFTLFLCKIYDEKVNEGTTKELDFQWKEGVDDDISFQLRLTDLYKNGMYEFLQKNVTDFSEEEFESKYTNLDDSVKTELLHEFKKIRLEKNNEFAIKEVYDEKSFKENGKVVKQVVELLQKYKIRYAQKQQYLSDFFELLLTTGLKQEAGQFFTPVPIAQFILKSLPIDDLVKRKLEEGKRDELLPYVIDYASGSGHFITESMHEIQQILGKYDISNLRVDAKKFVEIARISHFDWALQYVYGIEKDYRLVKVGKVGCYLHGDGLANVIHSDGLASFEHQDYKGKLRERNKDFPQENKQFDIIVSNPPYAIEAFRNSSREYYTEKDFELYENLTDNSSEIEVLFVERTKQLLKDEGVGGVILPAAILGKKGVFVKARELILKYFEIVAIAELGSNTFMATGINTVVFFIKRRNNYIITNLEKKVEKFFSNWQDVTLNGIEYPISKYVSHTWGNIHYNDYINLLKGNISQCIENHDLFQDYKEKIKADSFKELIEEICNIEKEKIIYFILAYPQQVVLVKTGEKEKEKRFLGYKFSEKRGREGIHPIEKSKTIEKCTKLFDSNSYDNPLKASTYIYNAFKGDLSTPIDESLKDNVSRIEMVDMLDFTRSDFDKNISLTVKNKIIIKSKYPQEKIEKLFIEIKNGRNVNQIDTQGKYRVSRIESIADATFNLNATKWTNDDINENDFLQKGDILFSHINSVKHLGKTAYFEEDELIVHGINLLRLRPNQEKVRPKFISEILKLPIFISEVQKYAIKAANQASINISNLQSLRVPLPPDDIQLKIITEIEQIEKNSKSIVINDMGKLKEGIFNKYL